MAALHSVLYCVSPWWPYCHSKVPVLIYSRFPCTELWRFWTLLFV